MEKGSKFGRKETETIWQSAEVDALFKLADAGVRVPTPYVCVDGVLLMELICGADGDVAPRLGDILLSSETALEHHATLMDYVVKMLCAGLVHGDLSEFNVLVDEQGPVIIDLPQAVDAAGNNHAQSMLSRDVNNLRQYYGQFAPALLQTAYADEIWAHYEAGDLVPGIKLTGEFEKPVQAADVDSVLVEISAAAAEEDARLARIQAADLD
jgi:RIO kinase 1